jgi:hypothetical protein
MITLDFFPSLLTLFLKGWANAVPYADKEFWSSQDDFSELILPFASHDPVYPIMTTLPPKVHVT